MTVIIENVNNVVYIDINPRFGQSKGKERIFNIDAVNEGIDTVLSTQRSNRLFVPEFGSIIPELLFEPMSEDTAFDLLIEADDALTRWEPRIRVLRGSSQVTADFDNFTYILELAYVLVENGQFSIFDKVFETVTS